MADLQLVLGGPWTPPAPLAPKAPEDQLIESMLDAGLTPPDHVILDGRMHRFSNGKKDKTAWYIAFSDNVPSGRFGCWRAGIDVSWRADIGRRLTPIEEMANAKRTAEARAIRDAEIAKAREIAADTVEQIWSSCVQATAEHPYLSKKGVQAHGARVTGDGRLVVPLFDSDGDLSTLQYISADGGKMFHPGGQSGGRFWMLGAVDSAGPLYVVEGFATAATINEATGMPCVAAYSASNIVPVVATLRKEYGPAPEIVIVADHDAHGVGKKFADEAAAKHGATVILPPIEGMDANDYAQAGHDLSALLNQKPDDDWLIPADDFSAQPAPISWLVKHWLQRSALMMVHGPSGGGKTFVVLDWCLRMASQTAEWAGHKVRPASVVYLAGEGHHGLRGRIAAWKHHHQCKSLAMWLSKDGCDLNTPEGMQKVIRNLRKLENKPDLIVVDTLHRFLSGDENSAQDAKTMIDACAEVMREFNCAVILVHHTGVSEEAQHRARGSSAWKGALDIEISVIPAKGNNPMQIVQRKTKDSEIAPDIYASLQSVEIPGWIDEDGHKVTSAVIQIEDAPAKQSTKSGVADDVKTFKNAWEKKGKETRDGKPYLTRSALQDYLCEFMELTPSTAKTYVKPGRPDTLIYNLLQANIIEPYHQHGWVVVEEGAASSMLLSAA
jgi:putative DNA primase/helicase